MPRFSTPIAAIIVLVATAVAAAQDCPIAKALAASDAEVRTYDTHVTTLSSPAMEGRLPGSPGMALAKD
ncbi:MAG: hypothetical protein ACIAQU_00480, partial [Phycisphaerales bacterium JB064]